MSQQYRKIFMALAAGAAVAGLAACGGVSGGASSTTPTGTNALPSTTASSEPADPTTPVDEPTETETPEDTTVKFGRTFTWENGLSATISAPKPYKPTDTAAGTEGFKYFVQFTVTIVNKTGAPFDPDATNHTVQSADVEGSRIFDSSSSLDTPSTKVLNGRQTKYKVAFGVTNPKDIVFEFAPGYEYNSAIWTK
jgi:hypothetical protein